MRQEATSIFGLELRCKGRDLLGNLLRNNTGTAKLLTWSSMLRAMHDKPMSRASMAIAYACSQQTIARVLVGGAEAFLAWQHAYLVRLQCLFQVKPPDVGVVSWMWDETAERVSIKLPIGTTREADSSAWDICVSRLRCAWGWFVPDDCGDRKFRSWFMDVVMPPIYLVANSSAHIYNGMERHPFLRIAAEIKKTLLDAATKFKCEIRASDGHLANHKIHVHYLASGEPMCMHLLCGNHSTQPHHCWSRHLCR